MHDGLVKIRLGPLMHNIAFSKNKLWCWCRILCKALSELLIHYSLSIGCCVWTRCSYKIVPKLEIILGKRTNSARELATMKSDRYTRMPCQDFSISLISNELVINLHTLHFKINHIATKSYLLDNQLLTLNADYLQIR